jgi:hypothetical protein
MDVFLAGIIPIPYFKAIKINNGHGHRFGRGGGQLPCPKGRREYILVDLSPASLLNTPLWQGN